jgi:hypothetical protein
MRPVARVLVGVADLALRCGQYERAAPATREEEGNWREMVEVTLAG